MDKELLVKTAKLFAELVISVCKENDCNNCIFGDEEHYNCIFDGLPFEWEII